MKRGFWPLRDLPVVFWFVAVLVSTLTHPWLPAPRWLMIHLLLLGAVSHSILVWSRYFADALLKTAPRPADRRDQSIRLALLNLGVVVVVAGVLSDAWPVTLAGASAVSLAVLWHGLSLVVQIRRSLPGRFNATVRYYVAAAVLLPVGAGLGTILARGLTDPLHDQLVLAHAAINLLGWIGLTIVGTLVTLWPTMLRTRIADGAERATRRALPVLLVSLLLITGGALTGLRWVAVLGVVGYLLGVVLVARPFLATARNKPPASFATWSVFSGLIWFVGCLIALAIGLATASTWIEAGQRFHWLTPLLAAGAAAQVLLGAMTYLVPMALGGGPSAVRAAGTEMDRGGALRITLVNGGLLVVALPVPSVVRVLSSAMVLAGLASFLPLMIRALRASRRAKKVTQQMVADNVKQQRAAEVARPAGQRTGMVATGLALILLAVAGGVAVDAGALPGAKASVSAAGDVAPTGKTTEVAVTAKDMRFTPSRIEVPAGNRLVITLTNTDRSDVHDLVLESGEASGRLAPGASARIDVGVIGRSIGGWCAVVGHRQMGMVFDVAVTGSDPSKARSGNTASGTQSGPDAADGLDFLAKPADEFRPHNAVLPPLSDEKIHRRTFTVREVEREVAPGVTQKLWTYNGTAPGPTLHGRIGDVFEITLVNAASSGHSIDFHAGALAPDGPMRTIAPGESLVYRFTATKAGIWTYHCSTMPMSAHIANGMFGAIVIEPPNLPAVDRSYVLIQSELYLGAQGESVNVNKVKAEKPDAVVFNGYANQYDHRPLPGRVGERVRLWVLDAGPNRATSFHVIGGQFDTVYSEGAYLLRPGKGGSQSLALSAAQGGFVELSFPEAGHFPFVSHVMVDAERGAHGTFEVR
ncbi:MAG: multicopper oxidase domain-containing protein [Kineosporiaceae bacterium]|nr:multicopper oxidase domain-containing protein [Aeromicrobium sp.]